MAVIKRPRKTTAAKVGSGPTSLIDHDKNRSARAGKNVAGPATKIAKCVGVQISIQDDPRSLGDFQTWIKKALAVVPYGEPGVHASLTSSYYIVDGLVYLADDFDSKTKKIREGAVPPAWAGGPSPTKLVGTDTSSSGRGMSATQYDKKYPNGNPYPEQPLPKASMKVEEEVEEIEWEMEDVDDEDLAQEIAESASAAAVAKIAKPKVVRKPAAKKAAPKKVVVKK